MCKRCKRFRDLKLKNLVPSQLDYKNMPPHDDDCPVTKAFCYQQERKR